MSRGNEGYHRKPNRDAFINYRYIMRILSTFPVFLVIVSILFFTVGSIGLSGIILYAAYLVLEYFRLSVAYSKEHYSFLGAHIIRRSGGLFSEHETELSIQNITHVSLSLPYLETHFYKTGTVKIESAGSDATEIVLRSIDNPYEFYTYIQDLMKHNGFSLEKKKLIQEERPSSLGVFFEVFKMVFGGISSLIIFLVYVGGMLIELITQFTELFQLVAFPILFLFLVVYLTQLALRFLDMKNRRYRLFDDCITYHEGFLTKNEAFIPVENLSDATTNQTLIDQIFGLYDVVISCQGSGQEMHFTNMEHGKELQSNIGQLIKRPKKKTIKKTPHKVFLEGKYTHSLTMDKARTLVPFLIALPFMLIVFPLLFTWVPLFITRWFKLIATKYDVKSKSIVERYELFSNKITEFTTDKVTGIVVSENIFDRIFNTWSIELWSIGSSQNIILQNIKKDKHFLSSLKSKVGIHEDKKIQDLTSHFSFETFIRANLFLSVIFFGLVLATTLFAFVIRFWSVLGLLVLGMVFLTIFFYKSAYYSTSKLRLFNDHMVFKAGLITKKTYFARYDNIKDMTAKKYPLGHTGNLTFNIAGESMVNYQNKSVRGIISSHQFTIGYVDGAFRKLDSLDGLLSGGNYPPQPVMEAQPAVINSLLPLFIISLIMFPLLIVFPFVAVFTVMWTHNKHYSLENHRIVSAWGIISKYRRTILYRKVDHIQLKQGFLNKLFRNATIIIHTVGSSAPEIVLSNTPGHQHIYEEIKSRYE